MMKRMTGQTEGLQPGDWLLLRPDAHAEMIGQDLAWLA